MDLNNKTIIVYCPILEFHTFIKCNLFLAELRKRHEHIKIVCSIPEKALGIISEADELLVYPSKLLDLENGNLPRVLDRAEYRDLSSRFKSTIDFAEKNYKDFIILRYNELNIPLEGTAWPHPALAWFGPRSLKDSFQKRFWILMFIFVQWKLFDANQENL